MGPVPSATHWGSPAASKCALLIHGNTCSSHTWETVGQGLAKAGFLVTAPNMLGHGHRQSDDLHVHTLAQDLYTSYFTGGTTYDVIIGHSLGGTVALALLSLLSTPQSESDTKLAVILLDPGIELSDQVFDHLKAHLEDVLRNMRTAEQYMAEHPKWTRQDAISRIASLHMVQSNLVDLIFEHTRPFSFRHFFDKIPSHVEMTILLSDPELSNICPIELVPSHPQIRCVAQLKGVSHWIPFEDPDIVVKMAVDVVERIR